MPKEMLILSVLEGAAKAYVSNTEHGYLRATSVITADGPGVILKFGVYIPKMEQYAGKDTRLIADSDNMLWVKEVNKGVLADQLGTSSKM